MSIRRQTRPVDEIIVVDDGSTDRSATIAESFGATVLRQQNQGEGAARNRGTEVATGEAIAWLDADDRWRPHHIAVVAGLLEQHPQVAGAFGAVQRFGLRHEVIRGYIPPGGPRSVLLEAFDDWLHTTIGSVLRRSALLAIGGVDEQERYSVDFDLWLRLARHHTFVASEEVTAEWRWHEGNQSQAQAAQMSAVYRSRRRFLDQLVTDGDRELSASLEAEFCKVWRRDMWLAMRARDAGLLRALRASASLVNGLRLRDRGLFALASRAPGPAMHTRRIQRRVRDGTASVAPERSSGVYGSSGPR